MDGAVDLRCVALAAAFRGPRLGVDLVDDDALAAADFALEPLLRNRLLALHEAVIALLFDGIGHWRREIVGGRAGDRLGAKAPDAIERSLIEPVEQQRKICFGLAGKADDEGRAN